ncbi:hypothetical protein NM688_g380 [Phlebia brevispora]|uniref:Uncharacterized protein n=1 Tax=Phlebia brevispora TaxID=194682 RepID=A0ACC1TEV9_9APHY|nr:hypothetical protein NM688_g380 [Phlebia brevispora]
MGAGAVAGGAAAEGYLQFVNPNRTWYNNRRLITLHAWIVLLLITSSTNGYDGSLMNSFQSLTLWNSYFGNPHGAYPFAPYLSDGIGRRITIWIGATIMLCAVAIQSAAQNINMFIAARFLIGFGVTFAANAAPMLVTELSYPLYRAQLTALYNSLWYSGNIVASWTTFGTEFINNTWAWRIPSILQGLPSVFQFFLVLWAPESPRWLVSKGRETAALKTLAYYHADGDETDPLVLFEFNEIRAGIELDRTIAANIGWTSLYKSKGNRRRMVIIIAIAFFSQWSGNGLVSYYLNDVFKTIGITNTTIQLLITAILAIWNLCWAVGASFACERLGRRFLFLTSASGMLLFFTMQTICTARYRISGSTQAAHAVIAFIFLFYASYDLAFTPLIVMYTVEILPYSLRAKGFNIFNFVISLALIFNQYVNPIAMDHINWKYYIVYCCWLLFELVFLYIFIVETMGLSLEETAAVFDGDDVKNAIGTVATEIRHDELTDEKGSGSFTPSKEEKV